MRREKHCQAGMQTESEEGKSRYTNSEDEALARKKCYLERKVGRLCHFVMTGCVSPVGTPPHSSRDTDTEKGTGTVTSLTPLLALWCVCVFV